MPSREWPDLRGAVLDRVTFDWRNGDAQIEILPGAELAAAGWIRAHGVVSVHVDVKERAGRIAAVLRESSRLRVETEAGGAVVISAASFAFERSDA